MVEYSAHTQTTNFLSAGLRKLGQSQGYRGKMLVLKAFLFFGIGSALKFLAEPSFDYYGGRGQCVKFRIPGHSLVTGFFKIAPQSDLKSNVIVYDSNGNQPFSFQDLTNEARFSFRSPDIPTEYDFCARVVPRNPTNKQRDKYGKVPIELMVNHDYDLFDETLAKDFKLKPIETEFIQLEDVMHRIVGELNNLVANEEAHRSTNESTWTRITTFGVISSLFLVGLSLGQVLYMRNFFKSKKLI